MPFIKTNRNEDLFDGEKRICSITNKLKTGDIFYLPNYCKIIANKDSESPEIIDGGCELVYENDGRMKSLHIINMEGLEQRCTVAKKIDGYLFYCAFFVEWKGTDPIKFSNIPENIATYDGLYDYIVKSVDKAAYEAFRPESSQEEFRNLFMKKLRSYVSEYGISIDDDMLMDGYMCEQDDSDAVTENKNEPINNANNEDDDELSVEIEDSEESEPVIKCKSCGYIPEGKIPKFCPECGTKFEF